ncbi:10779_t:CDS:2, partial [Ambispora leptoticha]
MANNATYNQYTTYVTHLNASTELSQNDLATQHEPWGNTEIPLDHLTNNNKPVTTSTLQPTSMITLASPTNSSLSSNSATDPNFTIYHQGSIPGVTISNNLNLSGGSG